VNHLVIHGATVESTHDQAGDQESTEPAGPVFVRRCVRWPAWQALPAAIFVSAAVFVGAVQICAFLVALGFIVLGKRPLPDQTFVVSCHALALVCTGWLGIHCYRWLRWRTVAMDQPTCSRCGYNLTANESGICPECGTRWRISDHERES
jgi:hypothetical protein